MNKQGLAFLVGGLLPVIAFTVVEEYYGTIAGLICGMIFGFGEIAYEYYNYKKVETITWIGNGLLIGLGGASLLMNDGVLFKLQPAILEVIFAGVLAGSAILNKPMLSMMMKKQNPNIPEIILEKFKPIHYRLAVFFLLHAVLATYAAFYWTTEQWALLKGVGLTVSMVIYMVIEALFIRRSIGKEALAHLQKDSSNKKDLAV